MLKRYYPSDLDAADCLIKGFKKTSAVFCIGITYNFFNWTTIVHPSTNIPTGLSRDQADMEYAKTIVSRIIPMQCLIS